MKGGLDIGGVIIDAARNDGTDTDLRGSNFMAAVAIEGSFEGVACLIERYGADNIFIISKCGVKMEVRTRLWLHGNGFYPQTNFRPDNLFFCRTREEKALLAQRLGITGFYCDDRADVLRPMKEIVNRRYLFGLQSDQSQDVQGLIVVPTWTALLAADEQAAA